ncbi:MAG: GNAT family N-acetyltransferase [Ruminococcaceae bacterium]|nr:GNAT family N-acetyltransferase [Oscillospiraceae bacterium]
MLVMETVFTDYIHFFYKFLGKIKRERKDKMLFLASKLHQLDFGKLMEVYVEGNQENGALMCPELSEQVQLLQAEQAFYQYLAESFFPTKGAVYAIWEEQGVYISALRLEPYEDGLLLAALETAPSFRRQGYAAQLVRAVQKTFPQKIYSHVSKENRPSLAVHRKCGFSQILEYARYIDGSVSRNAVTLCYP